MVWEIQRQDNGKNKKLLFVFSMVDFLRVQREIPEPTVASLEDFCNQFEGVVRMCDYLLEWKQSTSEDLAFHNQSQGTHPGRPGGRK